MALVVFNAVYFDGGTKFGAGADRSGLTYAATREGVQIIGDRECRELNSFAERSGLKYVAARRGAEHITPEQAALMNTDGSSDFASDGLFNAGGKADLALEENRRHMYPDSIEWRTVVSMKKEDAQRSGYTSPVEFQQLCTRLMPRVAKQYGISPENLVWNAAYHPVDKDGDDNHPHIHIHFYSTDATEGRLSKKATKKALKSCRSVFTNDIFGAEITKTLSERQTESRRELTDSIKKILSQPDPELANMLRDVSEKIPSDKRVYYGYLDKSQKRLVKNVVKRLIETPGINELYTKLCGAHKAQVEIYVDDPNKIADEMNKFKSSFIDGTNGTAKAVIHNAVICAAQQLANVPTNSVIPDMPDMPDVSDSFGASGVSRTATELTDSAESTDSAAEWELRDAVGLDAPYSLEHASPLLREVVAAYELDRLSADEQRKLFRKAQSDNLYGATRRVYDYMLKIPDLKKRLTEQTRLDVNPTVESLFSDTAEPDITQLDVINSDTRDDVLYYARVITSGYSSTSNYSLIRLIDRFTDIGLRDRARQIVSEYTDTPEFCELKKQTEGVRYSVKTLPASAESSLSAFGQLIFSQNEEAAGSKHYEKNFILLTNEMLSSAYYSVLNEQFVAIRKKLSDGLAQEIADNSGILTDLTKLPEETAAKLLNFINTNKTVEVDKSGQIYLANRLIGDTVTEQISKNTDLCRLVGLSLDTPISAETAEKINELIPNAEQIPKEKLRIVTEQIRYKCYSKNLSDEVIKAFKNINEHRAKIEDYSKSVDCYSTFELAPEEFKEKVSKLIPDDADQRAETIIKSVYNNALVSEHAKRLILNNTQAQSILHTKGGHILRTAADRGITRYDDFTKAMKDEFQDVCKDVYSANEELTHYYNTFKNSDYTAYTALIVLRSRVRQTVSEYTDTPEFCELKKQIEGRQYSVKTLPASAENSLSAFGQLILSQNEEAAGGRRYDKSLTLLTNEMLSSAYYSVLNEQFVTIRKGLPDELSQEISDNSSILTELSELPEETAAKLLNFIRENKTVEVDKPGQIYIANRLIGDTVTEQISKNTDLCRLVGLSLDTPLSDEVAEKINELIPNAEQIPKEKLRIVTEQIRYKCYSKNLSDEVIKSFKNINEHRAAIKDYSKSVDCYSTFELAPEAFKERFSELVPDGADQRAETIIKSVYNDALVSERAKHLILNNGQARGILLAKSEHILRTAAECGITRYDDFTPAMKAEFRDVCKEVYGTTEELAHYYSTYKNSDYTAYSALKCAEYENRTVNELTAAASSSLASMIFTIGDAARVMQPITPTDNQQKPPTPTKRKKRRLKKEQNLREDYMQY